MSRVTRTAVVQLCATPDLAENLATVGTLTETRSRCGAEVVLLPEAFAFLGPESAKRALLEALPETPGDARFEPGPILRHCQELARARPAT